MRNQLNLLIIEPSLGGRIVLRGHLEKLNYSVDFAWDIETVLVQAESKLYDFILVDEDFNKITNLPHFVESLRSKSNLNQETPIVLLSSSHNLEKSKSDWHHSFAKPIKEEDTLRLMEFLLKIKPLGLNR